MRPFSFVLLVMFTGIVSLLVEAQSCPNLTHCVVNNGCSGGYGPPTCSGSGQDPYCYEHNPDPCAYPVPGCAPGQHWNGYCCITVVSPLIFDLDGTGFHLTDVTNGVLFTVFPNNPQQFQVAWPAIGSHDAWLFLDRNGNGIVDDFGELFGNLTEQPTPPAGKERNGFLALAVFDTPAEGGNNDGMITKADAVFPRLRLWQDINHDGISQPNELMTLDEAGIIAISLDYRLSKRVDDNGNFFRYRSKIEDTSGSTVGMTVYDVFLGIGSARQQSSGALLPSSPIPLLSHLEHQK